MYYALKTELIQQLINFLVHHLHLYYTIPAIISHVVGLVNYWSKTSPSMKIKLAKLKVEVRKYFCTLHISPSSCEHSENTETSDDELSTPVKVGGI